MGLKIIPRMCIIDRYLGKEWRHQLRNEHVLSPEERKERHLSSFLLSYHKNRDFSSKYPESGRPTSSFFFRHNHSFWTTETCRPPKARLNGTLQVASGRVEAYVTLSDECEFDM